MGGGHSYVFSFFHVSEHPEHFFFCFFVVEKIHHFHRWGYPPPPFTESSAKINNSIFEPFPLIVALPSDTLIEVKTKINRSKARLTDQKSECQIN